jgi:hypothetical protein
MPETYVGGRQLTTATICQRLTITPYQRGHAIPPIICFSHTALIQIRREHISSNSGSWGARCSYTWTLTCRCPPDNQSVCHAAYVQALRVEAKMAFELVQQELTDLRPSVSLTQPAQQGTSHALVLVRYQVSHPDGVPFVQQLHEVGVQSLEPLPVHQAMVSDVTHAGASRIRHQAAHAWLPLPRRRQEPTSIQAACRSGAVASNPVRANCAASGGCSLAVQAFRQARGHSRHGQQVNQSPGGPGQ